MVPTNTAEPINSVLSKFEDIDAYVQDKLGYDTKDELYKALSAEQIDSVALGIQQIENGKAFIIGDMTGVGKGRQAAALLRYAVKKGMKPVFITEKAQLFSDIYRDLRDIGSPDMVPYIFNESSEAKITDEEGNVIYRPLSKPKNADVLSSGMIPDDCQLGFHRRSLRRTE